MRNPTDISCAYHINTASSRGHLHKNKRNCKNDLQQINLPCRLTPLPTVSPCFPPIKTLTPSRSYTPEATTQHVWYGEATLDKADEESRRHRDHKDYQGRGAQLLNSVKNQLFNFYTLRRVHSSLSP